MTEKEMFIEIAKRLGYKVHQEGDDYLEIYGDSYEPIVIEFSSDEKVSAMY